METKYKYHIHSEAVKEFTEGRLGEKVPIYPKALDVKAVTKIIGLAISELIELARTVTDSNESATTLVRNCVGMDPSSNEPIFNNEIDIISEQADAFIDTWYYILDTAAGHGMNLNKYFDEVHDANMRKKWSDGTFHLKEISPGIKKVSKPEGWSGPNVKNVTIKAFEKGSW